MQIALIKLDDDRHRLEVRREDGSSERVDLETRSYLLHDLVHYAVEAEADIEDGFWGCLARGETLAALSGRSPPSAPGLSLAEALVGPMQSYWRGRLDAERYVELFASAAPELVDAAFVERVAARLRALWGRWRATPFRASMDLEWPPERRP